MNPQPPAAETQRPEPAPLPGPDGQRRHWLASALAWGAGLGSGLTGGLVAAPSSARAARARSAGGDAPRLLLAQVAPADVDPSAYLVSEKLDGVRAFWDGQQLRFRGGGQVPAPDWFLAALPAGRALDGELWQERGRFDALSGAVRRQEPDDAAWQAISYNVFELPGAPGPFSQRAQALAALAEAAHTAAAPESALTRSEPVWRAIPQERLSSREALQARLAEVLAQGGEGLALHRADAPYQTGRSGALLKLKPVQDAEAVVLAHEPGQGRLAGKLGALKVRDDEGRVFHIGSGLTDAQRSNPPPLGSTISFAWRGRTSKGLPRFATLLRQREPGW